MIIAPSAYLINTIYILASVAAVATIFTVATSVSHPNPPYPVLGWLSSFYPKILTSIDLTGLVSATNFRLISVYFRLYVKLTLKYCWLKCIGERLN